MWTRTSGSRSNPDQHKDGVATGAFPFEGGTYDLTFHAVGENDGQSKYQIILEGEKIGDFECPLSEETYEEGAKFTKTFKDVIVSANAMIEVRSSIASKDGEEFSRARWSRISVKPSVGGKPVRGAWRGGGCDPGAGAESVVRR